MAKAKAKPKKKAKVDRPPPDVVRLEMANKFWEAEVTETDLVVRFGKQGTEGQVQKWKLSQSWNANSLRNDKVFEKIAKGYDFVLSPPSKPATEARNPQLEQAILGDPSDAAFEVYADWLQQQGDIRGDLAVFHRRLAARPNDKKLRAAEAQLRWDYRAHFYGPFAAYMPSPSASKKQRFAWEGPPVIDTWRQGWMDTLELGVTDFKPVPLRHTEELIRILPRVTSARFLRELVIARPVFADQYHFHGAMAAVAKVLPQLPALRRLTLGKFTAEDSELSWSSHGKLEPIWKAGKQLEYLKIRSGNFELGKLDLPELRELVIETGGLTSKNLKSVTSASWPELEKLSIWFGEDEYGCNCKPKDVAAILDGGKFPKLAHLGLKNCQFGDELAPMIVGSKILRRLETLDVSMSHLTSKGMAVYAANADKLAHLKAWDLSKCLLDDAAQKQAKKIVKAVNLERQDTIPEWVADDPDWRYARVGE